MAPSVEHDNLGAMAQEWLRNNAVFHDAQFSVPEFTITPGYRADVGGLCYFKDGRISKWKVWPDNDPHQECANREETKRAYHSSADTRYRYATCIFEAKVTRADFRTTFVDATSNRHEPMANVHIVVAPKGLLHPTEVPSFWGLLIPNGKRTLLLKPPVIVNVEDIKKRRDHFAHLILKKKGPSFWNRKTPFHRVVLTDEGELRVMKFTGWLHEWNAINRYKRERGFEGRFLTERILTEEEARKELARLKLVLSPLLETDDDS